MPRWFNIAGPCFADEHFMIPPERRAVEALELIAQGRWFVLVSGRQTGKTTLLQTLARTITAQGQHLALWVDLQTARVTSEMADTLRLVLHALDREVARAVPTLARPPSGDVEQWLNAPGDALVRYLGALCAASERPLVVLFDEADVLTGTAMVSFLTQLRTLYLARKEQPAPSSVVLAGVRAIRDYTLATEDRRAVVWLGTASPFNVTVESVGLTPFTADEVAELTAQHTAETGQRFEETAVARIYELSQGHPWLVNALADQATRRDVRDRTVAITAEHIERAKETLILERRTHLDSLVAKLREERVRRVLAPMLTGETVTGDTIDDDFAYVAGMGLIRPIAGRWEVANPIYREVIPRALTYATQLQLYQQTAWYVRADGLLDVPKLMAAWQTFWRKDGHLAAAGFDYREAGPHLMLMAFLQRIVNGGGRVEREYALGKGALDLMVVWKTQRVAVEVKLRRDTETEDEALEQVTRYLDTSGAEEGWLVLFDLRATTPWSERLTTRTREVEGRRVHVVGC
jgi:type II secretory pathway predicted ATPase ExeA